MPKRDVNQLAFEVVHRATEGPSEAEAKKNPDAVARGKATGAKGGRARAAKLTPEQRAEAARLAVAARWKKGGR